MESITLNTMPTWVVGIVMLYTSLVWLMTRKIEIRMDTRAIAYTLLLWGLLYSISGLTSAPMEEYLVVRVFMSRVVIIFLCLSQSIPLTVSYFRQIRREYGEHIG